MLRMARLAGVPLLVLAIMAAGLSPVFCEEAAAPAGTSGKGESSAPASQPYANSERGFSIEFPRGWNIEKPGRGPVVRAVSPPENASDTFTENASVVCDDLSNPVGAVKYADNMLDFMRASGVKFENLERGVQKIGDRDAAWITYTMQMADLRLRFLQYALVDGKTGYVITCTASADSFDRFRPVFESVANTLKITGPAVAPAETAGPAEAETLAGGNVHRNAEKDFSIEFPTGWKVETPAKGPAVKALSAKSDPKNFAVISVFSKALSAPMTVQEYQTSSMERAQQAGMMPLDAGTMTIDGQDAGWFAYSAVSMIGEVARGAMYFVVKDQRAFRIDCNASPQAFETYKPLFDAIASSFKFEAGEAAPGETPASGTTGETGPAAAEGTAYEDQAAGFSTVFPSDWTVSTRGIAYAVSAVSPMEDEADGYGENISVLIDNTGKSPNLEAYEAAYAATQSRKSPTFQPVESGLITLGGKEGRYLIYTIRMGAMQFRNISYFFSKAGRVCVVAGQAMEESFDKFRPVFEAVATSLELKAPPAPKKRVRADTE